MTPNQYTDLTPEERMAVLDSKGYALTMNRYRPTINPAALRSIAADLLLLADAYDAEKETGE